MILHNTKYTLAICQAAQKTVKENAYLNSDILWAIQLTLLREGLSCCTPPQKRCGGIILCPLYWNTELLMHSGHRMHMQQALLCLSENFRPYFQKSRLEYFFFVSLYFSSPYSGHFRSEFVFLQLLLTAKVHFFKNILV